MIEFLVAADQFGIICSSVTLYFSEKTVASVGSPPGESDVSEGLWWTFRYHIGTLAFGSLLLTILRLIRSVFEYMADKNEGFDL